jgi:hypothetical protein
MRGKGGNMETVKRFRAEDIVREVNEHLEKFSLENNVNARIRLSREKNHLIDLLLYILSKDEGFDKERFGLNIRFAFPLSSGKFLGTGLTLFSSKQVVNRPVIVNDIEGGLVKNPTMWIVMLPNFYLFDNANKAERFRIYSFLEDLGFNTQDYSFFPYIEYSLHREEYLLEE